MKSNIIFIQESHLTKKDMGRIQKRWPGQIYAACFNSHSRGVMILLNKSVPFHLNSKFIDPAGRYVILNGTINSILVNLVSVYAPNKDDPSFYQNLFLSLSTYPGQYVIGGDLNCVLDPSVDRSTGFDVSPKQTRKVIKKLMAELNLTDTWRCLNPDKREYSCFSSVYKTYSRIDYFLISNTLLSKIGKCWYDAILLSDHAPISMTVQLPKALSSPPRFRFQSRWLQCPDFVKFLDQKIDEYFLINTNQTSASIKWEAFKAFLRGEIISYTKYRSKKYHEQLNTIKQKVKELERQIYHKNIPEKQQELLRLKAQYSELTTSKIASNLLWLKQSYYDHGEKVGKLLAWRIKKIHTERAINMIKSEDGRQLIDPDEINTSFANYYENLYKSECPNGLDDQNRFLDRLNFPTITEEANRNLETKLTVEELLHALMGMNSGRAPGPDGLPVEIYKKFSTKLLPHLLEVFNESYERGFLPPSMRAATISLLLKPNKPPSDKTSYRPISLMSCDTKILSKALSKRIETLLPSIINNDQNGFVLNRQAFHNTRRLLNVLFTKQNTKGHAILSLDAEKAFDRIEWGYLFDILKRFGLGEKYLKWIRLLYAEPMAEILTNNRYSTPFKLYRSTRQGCPISPLLFVLAIEPLAMAIRQSAEITGITIGRREHRLALFADDIVLFLSNLDTSLVALNHILNEFGLFSGYRINKSKSALLMLNKEERQHPLIQTQFAIATEGLTYLGIKITPEVDSILSANYNPLVKGVEDMLDGWGSLPISMIGRINIIKMSILPKFLYLFQSIPLPPPASFFNRLKKIITNFIWNNKRPRLRLSLLYLPFDRGGLRLPNMKFYYWAAQLRAAMFYFMNKDVPIWVEMESSSTELPLCSYMYSAQRKTLLKQTHNPFLRNTISIWHDAHTFLNENIKLSCFTPIWRNDSFKPGRQDVGFKQWIDLGISKMKDLFNDHTLMSFQQLVDKYNLPRKHFFKYLQIRSFIHAQSKTYATPPLSQLEQYTVNHLQGRGQLSKLYNILLNSSKENSHSYLSSWRNDLHIDITTEEWEKACSSAQTQSINTKGKLLQYKWLFRTYITPVKLNHFNPNIPDYCYKCNTERGTLLHCIWECQKLQTFWKDTLCLISRLTECKIPLEPKLCLLHIYPKEFVASVKKRKLIDFCLLQAKRVIALKWKDVQSPVPALWLKEMSSHLALEKLTYILKGKTEEFKDIWTPFLHFMDTLSIDSHEQRSDDS